MPQLDLDRIRPQFPGLFAPDAVLQADAASGIQVHESVVHLMLDYLTNGNHHAFCQYDQALENRDRQNNQIPIQAAKIFNAASKDEITFSNSATQNVENLVIGLEEDVRAGEEIIVAAEHEAHFGPWKKLGRRCNAVVKIWKPRRSASAKTDNPYALVYDYRDLLALMTSKTRIVAFAAASNIFGSILPVKDIVAAVRKAAMDLGCRKIEVSVDCVQYAPHRRIDVQDWDIDYAVVSYYKFGGPHCSAMYVRSTALSETITDQNHHFFAFTECAHKIGHTGFLYETAWATTGLVDYYRSLTPESTLESTFEAIKEHEQKFCDMLLTFLTAPEQYHRGVRVIGNEVADEDRIPTISFVILGLDTGDFVTKFTEKYPHIGIKGGNSLNYGAFSNLEPKIDPGVGAVRIAFVHYNTTDEVQRVIDALRVTLDSFFTTGANKL